MDEKRGREEDLLTGRAPTVFRSKSRILYCYEVQHIMNSLVSLVFHYITMYYIVYTILYSIMCYYVVLYYVIFITILLDSSILERSTGMFKSNSSARVFGLNSSCNNSHCQAWQRLSALTLL